MVGRGQSIFYLELQLDCIREHEIYRMTWILLAARLLVILLLFSITGPVTCFIISSLHFLLSKVAKHLSELWVVFTFGNCSNYSLCPEVWKETKPCTRISRGLFAKDMPRLLDFNVFRTPCNQLCHRKGSHDGGLIFWNIHCFMFLANYFSCEIRGRFKFFYRVVGLYQLV